MAKLTKKERFSIRKSHLGAASVLVGLCLVANNQVVQAHQLAPGELTEEEIAKKYEHLKPAADDSKAHFSTYMDEEEEEKSDPVTSAYISKRMQGLFALESELGEKNPSPSEPVSPEKPESRSDLTDKPVAPSQPEASRSNKPETDKAPLKEEPTSETPAEADKVRVLDAKAGRHVFEENRSIKAQPRIEAPDLAIYPKGDSVFYDRIIAADGYKWLAYRSYNGNLRYVLLEKLEPAAVEKPAQPTAEATSESLPEKGSYRFGRRMAIRNQPRLSSPEVYYYEQGESVRYDKVLKEDGYQWISYVSYNGTRRYIAIEPLRTVAPAPKVEEKSESGHFPPSGTYHFTSRREIRNEARLAAPVVYYYEKGNSVVYDHVLEADGMRWISYVSYQGKRRYVALDKVEVIKPLEDPKVESKFLPSSGTYVLKESLPVRNQASKEAKVEFYSGANTKIHYDRLIEKDGVNWLSYVSYSGTRRYIELPGGLSQVDKPVEEPKVESASFAASGYHTFKVNRPVYTKPDASLVTNRFYPKGQSVYYDRSFVDKGVQWISYVSYSGERLYVKMN